MMENINLELYKTFYYVALYKNVTKASEFLLVSQPAITQTIKKLEDELGYKLFFRTSRGMELTKIGEDLFNRIKGSIENLNSCKNYLEIINGNEEKIIRVGGSTTLLKYNAILGFIKFRNQYPDIKIDIVRGITDNLLDALNNDDLDLVFVNMPVREKDKLVIEAIEDVQDVFVASSNNFKNLQDKVFKLEEVTKLPLVLQSPVSSTRKFLDNICLKGYMELNNVYELESYDLVLSFVKAGLGIGFVNERHVLKELNDGTLFKLRIDFEIPRRKIGILYNKRNINNRYIRYFIDCMKEK